MDDGTVGTIGTGYYVGIGYDDHLRRITALSTDTVTGFQFDTTNDRDIIRKVHMGTAIIGSAQIEDASITNAKIANLAVTSAKINDFSFNQGTGGTLTLGGTNNGNGVLNVNNAAGSNVVTLNNTGLTVTNGSVTIQNTSGSTIIDSQGLVSTTNFLSDSFFGTNVQSFSSTSFTDYPNGSLSVVLARQAKVLITYSGDVSFSGISINTEYGASVALNLNGTIQNYPSRISLEWSETQANQVYTSTGKSQIYTLPAGTHAIKLQVANLEGVNSNVGNVSLLYMVLGK